MKRDFHGRGPSPKEKADMGKEGTEEKWVASYWKAGQRRWQIC